MAEIPVKAQKLIDEAAILSERIKKDEKRLKEIKEELKGFKLDAGIYDGYKGSSGGGGGMDLSYRKDYDPPTPVALLDYLKSIKKGKFFPQCVKVQAGETAKIIGQEAYDSLRTEKKGPAVFKFK